VKWHVQANHTHAWRCVCDKYFSTAGDLLTHMKDANQTAAAELRNRAPKEAA
jgi:hypothetical protein